MLNQTGYIVYTLDGEGVCSHCGIRTLMRVSRLGISLPIERCLYCDGFNAAILDMKAKAAAHRPHLVRDLLLDELLDLVDRQTTD